MYTTIRIVLHCSTAERNHSCENFMIVLFFCLQEVLLRVAENFSSCVDGCQP